MQSGQTDKLFPSYHFSIMRSMLEKQGSSHSNQLNPEQLETAKTVKYIDIYNCLEIQKVMVTVYSWLLNIRERLLEAAIPASGTSLVAASCLGGVGDSQ